MNVWIGEDVYMDQDDKAMCHIGLRVTPRMLADIDAARTIYTSRQDIIRQILAIHLAPADTDLTETDEV